MNKIVILSVATVAVLTFSGCGNKSSDEGSKNAVTTAVEKTKEAASSATDAVKESAHKVVETTKEAATKTTEAVKETATKAVEATKEAASSATEKAKEAVSGGNSKGKAAYAKCVSCHGTNGKTKALGKSEVIAGQSVADLEKKIQEYKAGTRNVAGMGMLMHGQVKGLSDEDVKAVSEYISSLK